MRVNIYAEEISDNVEIIEKDIEGHKFTGLRFYLYLPVTANPGEKNQRQLRGPFIHRPGDDDSSAVTFWGKSALRATLRKALRVLDRHRLTCAEGEEAVIDEVALMTFFEAMDDKLWEKRLEGCGGWHDPAQCTIESLWDRLREHVEKGDPVDVANYAMMIWNRQNNDTDS